MDEATWAKLAMMRGASTRSPDIGVVAMLADMAARTTERSPGCAIRFKRPGLSERRDKARVASYLVCTPQLLGAALSGRYRIDTEEANSRRKLALWP